MFSLIFLLAGILSAQVPAAAQVDFKKGEIIPKVVCRDQPAQSYALYLPLEYTPEKQWPVLFAFDPGARGVLPLQHFQAAAEKYQYIVIGSNNSRNGPWKPVFQAMIAIWNDVIARLSIDPNRIYAAGFSGGARAAVYFPKIINLSIRGIIGCGAGLPEGVKAEDVKSAYYLGIIGDGDFNYLEMKTLDQQFDASGTPHWMLVFAGSHDWPSSDFCQRALSWMEIVGMTQKVRDVDEDLIADVYNTETQHVEKLADSGQIFQAAQEYEVIAVTFQSLRDIRALKEEAERLKQDSLFESLRKQEEGRTRKEMHGISRHMSIITQIEKETPPLHLWYEVFRNLKISEWQEILQQKEDEGEAKLAVRQLFGLETEARSKGGFYLYKGDIRKAILFFEIAVRANPQVKPRLRHLYYYLALAYARGKDAKQAIKNLKLAVENGFEAVDVLVKEDGFVFLKKFSGFQEILKTLQQKKDENEY